MAEVLFWTIEFTGSNPYGEFVAGDVVTIFYDQTLQPAPVQGSSVPIIVRKNGTVVTSGAPITTASAPYKTSNYTQLNICVGTTKVRPIPNLFNSYPYAYTYLEENSPSCEIDPSVCDLMVVGVPTVFPASDSTTADGQITVTASSSNTIQYKIGTDFVYDDGSAQSTGIFTGLVSGQYRIYLRDSKNCGANVLVNVTVDNSYGVLYRNEYYDINGWRTKVEIVKRAYSGSVTEVCNSGTPFEVSLRGEGSLNKFEPIQSCDSNTTLVSEVDEQFVDIYTNDPNLFRMYYYKDFGSGYEQLTSHKVLPQQSQYEHKATPYYFNVVATDALSELSNFYLIQDDGQKYFGTISLIKLVAFCLGKIRLDLPIRVACNLYATTMDTAASSDPFDQAYVDFERFYIAQEQPTLDLVMRSILKPFGCCVKQWENRWNIVRVEEQAQSYDYRNFDKDGEYLSNGTFNPVIEIDYPANNGEILSADGIPTIELKPGHGQIKAVYGLGLKPNVIDNGDFRLTPRFVSGIGYLFDINKDGMTVVNGGYAITEGWEFIDEKNVALSISADDTILNDVNGGEAYIKTKDYQVKMGTNNNLKINLRYKINRPSVLVGSTVYTQDVPYIKVRVIVKYGYLYLQSDGNWTTQENELVFNVTEYNKYIESEIVANYPAPATEFSATLASTANVSLSGEQTIDGVLTSSTRVLLKDQSDSTNNGIWVTSSGGWSRASDMTSGADFIKAMVVVSSGTVNAGKYFIQTNPNPGVLTDINFNEVDPDDGLSASEGMPFHIELYHAYAYHAQFQSLSALKAFPTYTTTTSTQLVPVGYKTELRDDFSGQALIHYYELEENTDPENGYSIVRPDNYNSGTNPYQWVRKSFKGVGGILGVNTFAFFIDRISMKYLTDKNDPIDAIIRFVNAEGNNKSILPEELIIGSYSSLIVTETNYSISLGFLFPNTQTGLTLTTRNVLSADLIYTGYLRDENGIGFEYFRRDGISEADKLHGIFLKMYAAQYKSSWKLFRGSFKTNARYFGMLNVAKDVNDSNIIYIPMALTLNDRRTTFSAEFAELKNMFSGGGSDGSPEAPFTSGFSTGFGKSGFN